MFHFNTRDQEMFEKVLQVHLNLKPINQSFEGCYRQPKFKVFHPTTPFFTSVKAGLQLLLSQRITETCLYDVVDEAMLAGKKTKKVGSRTQERTVKSCGRMIVSRRALVATAEGFRSSVETILCHVFTWNTYYLHMYRMKKNIEVRPEGPPNNL